ncbi:MAG: Crp/Fnr family transcriptional regulator, partial [Lysobacteraceae bacterium]
MPTIPKDAVEKGGTATARLSAFGSLDRTELAGLTQLGGLEQVLGTGETLWKEGDRLPGLFVLLDGWMVSTMNTGASDPVTVKVHLPGDILGLPGLAFVRSPQQATTLTRVRLLPISLASFGRLFSSHPRVAAIMFLVSQQERLELMDKLAARATSDVTQRLAAFVNGLHSRVKHSFPDTGDAFHLPLSRRHVADLIGATLPQLTGALKTQRTDNVFG